MFSNCLRGCMCLLLRLACLGRAATKNSITMGEVMRGMASLRCCCLEWPPCAAAAAWLPRGPPTPCPAAPWPEPPVAKREEECHHYYYYHHYSYHMGLLGEKSDVITINFAIRKEYYHYYCHYYHMGSVQS